MSDPKPRPALAAASVRLAEARVEPTGAGEVRDRETEVRNTDAGTARAARVGQPTRRTTRPEPGKTRATSNPGPNQENRNRKNKNGRGGAPLVPQGDESRMGGGGGRGPPLPSFG